MSETPYPVGYGRPPEHTRFQKGRSANPGGKPGPKKRLKQAFDAALGEALNGDEAALRAATPTKVVERFARQVALDALEGRASAQRLVLAILDREGGGAADEESRDETAAAFSDDEDTRQLVGERYEEFKTRFERAVANESGDELVALAKEFAQFPQSGNF